MNKKNISVTKLLFALLAGCTLAASTSCVDEGGASKVGEVAKSEKSEAGEEPAANIRAMMSSVSPRTEIRSSSVNLSLRTFQTPTSLQVLLISTVLQTITAAANICGAMMNISAQLYHQAEKLKVKYTTKFLRMQKISNWNTKAAGCHHQRSCSCTNNNLKRRTKVRLLCIFCTQFA